jgi:hypothetical protein
MTTTKLNSPYGKKPECPQYRRSQRPTDLGPVAHSNRGDRLGLSDEFAPSSAGGVHDRIVVVAREGKKIGVIFWARRACPWVCHPALSSADRRGPRSDVSRDFACRRRRKTTRAPPRRRGPAGRAEQISVVIALVGGLPRLRSAPSPLPNLAVLLADADLVPKPDFHRRRFREYLKMSPQRTREVF